MKKLTLLLIALIGVLTMNAKVVTEQEALLKAQRFMQGKRFMQGRRLNQSQTQARRVAQKNVPAYYIFNVEHEDGFVIVSGDDRTPEILGYSEHGNLNPDNAPDNVKWWLSEYERQIEWLLNSADEGAVRRAAETSHRDGWAAIEPLVESQWDQDAPYNDLCPSLDGEKTYTGCVATAMAQIMNYHQWPTTGMGSKSYDWNGQTLSMDFSDVTFDWGNMQNTYSDNGKDDSPEAKNAVATLMYACGISVSMDYGTDGSGASKQKIESAFSRNFGYDASYVDRRNYELSDWESMIYTDLSNKRPVLYGGEFPLGGHAFVCDGYSTDGLFHINWGWGGSLDGYFLLNVLDPYGLGYGYTANQAIIYGICPARKALIDGVYYALLPGGEATVTSPDEGYYTGDIVIPSTIIYEGETYKVTKMQNNIFQGCSSLTSLVIGDGVACTFGMYTFYGCSSLTSIVLGDGVTGDIDVFTFLFCSSLTSIVIGNGVTSIGYRAFAACPSLASVVIGNGVTSIGDEAFSGCSVLTSINIPEGVMSIGNMAFSGCSALISSINIPEGVTSIEYRTFYNCSSLTSISIPKGVTSIGDMAFYGCSSLTSINIPEGVTSIGSSAFSGCSALTSSINIPEGVTSIEDRTFYNCSSLTSINIPESVTSIGDYAFSGCSALTSINIPEGVTSIGKSTFFGCSSLTSSINIPEGVTSIGDWTFYNCSSLTSINIPESVTRIGDYAFSGCSALTSINIPEGVTSIGSSAFSGCSSLTSINIPEGVTSIGDYAFTSCRSLTTVICRAENVPELGGNYVFYNVPISEATLYVPASALEAYKAAEQWKEFGTILPLEEEEEKVTLAIGDAHYATFIAPFDVKIPANVTAYTVSGIKEDGKNLQMDELTRTIPANTPVVLYSNDMVDETVTGIRTTQETTYTHGLLTGVYTEIQAPADSYVLQNQNGEVAFYYVAEGSQPAVKANRAYLTVPNANGIKALRFGNDNDETTGIQTTVSDQENKAVIYDMTGRRVEKAVKGMYIIDGKKVMVK